MSYRVGKTKDGRVLVLEDTGFAASFVDGKWVEKILFSATEQHEDFVRVRDQKEARDLYSAACKALGRKRIPVSN